MALATRQNDTPAMNRRRRTRRRTARTLIMVRLTTNRSSKIAASAGRGREGAASLRQALALYHQIGSPNAGRVQTTLRDHGL